MLVETSVAPAVPAVASPHPLVPETPALSSAPRDTAKDTSSTTLRAFVAIGALLLLAFMVWQAITTGGNPDPLAPHTSGGKAILDISVLVFREGLESILVLSAITASMTGSSQPYQRPIAIGVAIAFVATVLTWFGVVGIIDDLSENLSALQVQAATGLLAIIVLLVVMNWFFHKVYWTGWIAMHTKKKRKLLSTAADPAARRALLWGMLTLGFTSFYREGFEVVLFLQSYRLQRGTPVVLNGLLIGMLFTGIVAVLTFVAHKRLPYKRMLILTGALLGVVLLVMVGEQAQEMQLAKWIPTTVIPALQGRIPDWVGLWFAVFPTVEGLLMQGVAVVLVLGSYIVARAQIKRA